MAGREDKTEWMPGDGQDWHYGFPLEDPMTFITHIHLDRHQRKLQGKMVFFLPGV